MVIIIFGLPKSGKTALLTYFLNEAAFNHERIRLQISRIQKLNSGGFNLQIPDCSIYANYELKLKKFGCPYKKPNLIDPFKLGYSNDDGVDTYYLPPYSVIGITEGQTYFDAREFQTFKWWKSRYFEQHAHNKLDIYIDAQRGDLIDLNIRSLAKFIEVVDLDEKTMTWTVREIDNIRLFNQYIKNESDCSGYTERQITSNDNIFSMYNAWECEALHHAGHIGKQFYTNQADLTPRTKEAFENYIKQHNDEFRPQKKTKKVN